MERQPNSRMCFVCGTENPIGLKLKFYTHDEGRCITRFRPKPEHQGYPGHLHGGIISTLLDETMGRVLTHRDVWAMTGRLEIKFRKPVPLDQELTIVGELTRSRSRGIQDHCSLHCRRPGGETAAAGPGLRVDHEPRPPQKSCGRNRAGRPGPNGQLDLVYSSGG